VDSGRQCVTTLESLIIEEMPPTIWEDASKRFHKDDPVFSDDPLLMIAYAISEQAIAVLGPTFWIVLAYLFLA
jgi:hypothetical protein